MVITKDLGAVSAYAYAVEQGYQGTEEEFAELMARQATVAEEAAASADAAAESASEAQASAEQAEQSAQSISGDVEHAEQAATTATNKATEAATSAATANGAAQTATGKASEASASATAAASSASSAAQSATNAAASATAAANAQTAAETAQGKAEDAQVAAEAAAQSVSESAAQIAKNTDNIASEFSTSTTYAIGDYCIHEGTLYRFINEHTGAWSASDVEATNVGEEVSELKSALDEYKDGFANLNIFGAAELLYEDGYATIDSNTGKISQKQIASWCNAYILPVDGINIYSFTECRFAFLVASDKQTAIGNLLQYATQINTTGASYICFSINKDNFPPATYQVSKGTTLQTGYQLPWWAEDALENKIDKDGEGQVKPQNIEGVTVTGGNILDDAERVYCSQPSYVGNDGYVTISDSKAIIQYSSSFCSFLIAVKPNTHYTANNSIRFAVLLKNLATEGTTPVKYTTVVGSALANISSFDTGEADHIIVSWAYSTYPINTFVISEGNTPTTDVEITLPDWWTGGAEIVKPKYISTTGSLSNGTFMALMGYKQNLRKGERYVFSGDLTTMSELHFGFTYANSFSASSILYNEFIIDSTYITYKTDGSSASYTERFEHGLTFANNLQFIFEHLPEGNAKITLLSHGVAFTQTLSFTKKTISQVVVLSVGSTLTNCKLTWTPIDIDKSIWMFGDSYFAYSSDRWTYYLQQYGYAQNALIDGWPGEGSVNARNSLLTLIQFGTPKYIVWCMGMNDGSDTDASTPSADWVANRDSMLSICEVNGITPIFATIPNVPSVLNTGKNAWIKASGYRYIDFAASVGAESAGSTWYSGMLSSDNVHPSESGAKALFARALVDFPEIMLND